MIALAQLQCPQVAACPSQRPSSICKRSTSPVFFHRAPSLWTDLSEHCTKSAISAVDIIARWNVVASLSLRSLQQCILAPWHFFGGPPLNLGLTYGRLQGVLA